MQGVISELLSIRMPQRSVHSKLKALIDEGNDVKEALRVIGVEHQLFSREAHERDTSKKVFVCN